MNEIVLQGLAAPRFFHAIARGAALVMCGALLLLFLSGLTLVVLHGHTQPELLLPGGWSPDAVHAALDTAGIPPGWHVGYRIGLEIFLAVACVSAALLLAHGPRVPPFRLYLALVLVLHATAGGDVLITLRRLWPALRFPAEELRLLAWLAFFPIAYLFPNGHLVPRWSRWLVLGWGVCCLLLMTLPAERGCHSGWLRSCSR